MEGLENKIIIAGPCSAESQEQLDEVVGKISEALKLHAFRGGVWKPRTRPNNFEGKGEEALSWMQSTANKNNVPAITEVANATHVELALKKGFQKLWIGARTTTNPFAVQEIANALAGNKNLEIFIKNPINPDINLWVGATERISNAGIENIGLIHRGFSVVGDHQYRNVPMWQIPLEMMTLFPNYPMLVDPSHIAGNRDLIFPIIQKAMDLAFHGIIVETHPDPPNARSDPDQQIKPERLIEILQDVVIRQKDTTIIEESLEELRAQIDVIDEELLNAIRNRMNIAQKIGQYKKQHGITIYQKERWSQIVQSRKKIAEQLGLSHPFLDMYLDAIHLESIRQQNNVMNPHDKKKNE